MSQTSRNDLLEACSGAGESARVVILTLFWTVMVPLFAYTARQVNKSGDFRNFFENSWEPQRHLLVCTSSLQSGGFRTCPLGAGADVPLRVNHGIPVNRFSARCDK